MSKKNVVGGATAAAGATPPGGIDIADWIATHIKRAEAAAEPKRRHFVSKLRKRADAAATQWGVDDVRPLAKWARTVAGDLHDAGHKKG